MLGDEIEAIVYQSDWAIATKSEIGDNNCYNCSIFICNSLRSGYR